MVAVSLKKKNFFKQKTAYEIWRCDWSSDVCSSDLVATVAGNGCLIIIRMDSFLHDFHLFLYNCELLTAALLPKPVSGQCCSDVATARYPGLSLQVPAVRFPVCGPKMSQRHKTTFVFYHTAFQKASKNTGILQSFYEILPGFERYHTNLCRRT